MIAEIALEIHTRTNAHLLPRVVPLLKCPECGTSNFEMHNDTSTRIEFLTHCVVVCNACKTCFHYSDGILDMLIEKPNLLTRAQKTNFTDFVANNYQSKWRPWCMSVFCGRKFSNRSEAEKLIDMTQFDRLPQAPVLVDFGTGHGFYAVAMAKKLSDMKSGGFVIAIDFSRKMLHRALDFAEKNRVGPDILWVVADVEKTPIESGSVDRVTCGGSLNEYQQPETAVAEACRILKKESVFYAMNLFLKNGWTGWFQKFAAFSLGLSYHPVEHWNRVFGQNKLEIGKQDRLGAVMFTSLKKQ